VFAAAAFGNIIVRRKIVPPPPFAQFWMEEEGETKFEDVRWARSRFVQEVRTRVPPAARASGFAYRPGQGEERNPNKDRPRAGGG